MKGLISERPLFMGDPTNAGKIGRLAKAARFILE
jgi:hypothetical protein